jgi:hypothetical protein
MGKIVSLAAFAVGFGLVLSAVSGLAVAATPLPDTPEIDPSSMMGAMTLFVGGALLLAGKCRKA